VSSSSFLLALKVIIFSSLSLDFSLWFTLISTLVLNLSWCSQVIQVGETVDLLELRLREEMVNSRQSWPIGDQDAGDGWPTRDQDAGGGKEGIGWGRNLKTHLMLMTNLTSVKIPLLVFDGKLKPVG
jgi:hypothetical protein